MKKRHLVISVVFLLSCLWGCKRQLARQDCVGSYVYVNASGKQPANLIVNEDGTYTSSLILRDRPSLVVPGGQWKFDIVGSYTQVALGRSSFPVERHGKFIRITIDDDLGEWFEKGD